MRNILRNSFLTISACAVVVLSACSDQGATVPDTRATPRFTTDPSSVPCTDPAQIDSLIIAYFGAGSPDANSALGKWDNIQKQKAAGNTADVTTKTWSLVDFLITKQQQNKRLVPHWLVPWLVTARKLVNGLQLKSAPTIWPRFALATAKAHHGCSQSSQPRWRNWKPVLA